MSPDIFLTVAASLAMIFLIWNCFEVGRNDAANLVNAVFGSRVMRRRPAVYLAGTFVVLGATFASPVMDTVRKGLFDLMSLDANAAVTVFLCATMVGTILLYCFSAFGMPVSTTATLIFCLAGSAIGVGESLQIVNWETLNSVMVAILGSIILSGIAGFLVQRILRGVVRDKWNNHTIILLHGPWISGLILTSLTWFMIVKGLKGIGYVKTLKTTFLDAYGAPAVLLVYWGILTLAIHLVLTFLKREYARYLFHATAIVGMCAMSFAFGQNDLANAASPGLSSFFIWQSGVTSGLVIPRWTLFACGFLIFLGMTTENAQRVTRAEVNVASQHDDVNIYAPGWCIALGKLFSGKHKPSDSLAPAPSRNLRGKKYHYDPVRASVIMSVSASVIAFASGLGIPVSTTYVAFASVVATGWGDRVYAVGGAEKKIGRALWTVTCWFLSSIVSLIICGFAGFFMARTGLIGVGVTLALLITIKVFFQRTSDKHEKLHHKATENDET